MSGRSGRLALGRCGSAIVLAAAAISTATGQSGTADTNANVLAKVRDERLLLLAAADWDPLAGVPPLPVGLSWSTDDVAPTDYFIVQLRSRVMPSDHDDLAALGAEELAYVPHHAFIVRMETRDLPALFTWERTRAIVPFEPAYRVEPELLERAQGWLDVAIFLFAGADPADATAQMVDLGVDLFEPDAGLSRRLLARVPADRLVALAHVRDVQWIAPASVPALRNDTTAWVIQSNVTDQTPVWNQGILGDNTIIGHIDGALDLAACWFDDPAVANPGPTHRKVVSHHGSSGAPDSHGTHTAGTAAGDQEPITGLTDDDGIAYRARIAHTNLSLISSTNLNVKLDELYGDGARLFTNSWGDDTTTKYNAWCVDIDQVSFDNPDALICFSTTNFSSLKNPENAKNVLAVGASEQAPSQANWFSGGKGPTADGRRKPEIYSPGEGIHSAKSGASCSTRSMSGTSMACPSIAAAAALAKQYFEEGFWPTGVATAADGFVPSGALLKAVLIDASVDMTGVTGYPSDKEGWGRLKLDGGLEFSGDPRHLWLADVQTGGFDAAGQAQTHYVHVDSGSLSLELCLCFMDVPGAVNASQPVVNDLDLEVVDPVGTLFRGNVFSGGVSIAGGSADPLNNVERVKLAAPLAGWYTVTIGATTIASTQAQPYALVATGDLDPPLAGGFVAYGAGTPGTGGFVPGLSGGGEPAVGGDVTIDLANGRGGASALLLVGFARTSLPFAGGSLLVAPPWIVLPLQLGGASGVGGAGSSSLPATLPPDPAFVGAIVDLQSVIFDPAATRGLALTNGLELTVGS